MIGNLEWNENFESNNNVLCGLDVQKISNCKSGLRLFFSSQSFKGQSVAES